MSVDRNHDELAGRLGRRVLESGVVARELREGALALGGGGDARVPEPYRALADTIAEASFRVTDQQVAAVREAAGSERAAFEIVMAASIGAGLRRWDAAIRAIEEASDAAS
ncbi:MAG: hypothetical protein KF801_01200 [Cryobacterium sp.]|nr:hypothetical protein [Cryobacterium sp.]